jgi:hypothetical protein
MANLLITHILDQKLLFSIDAGLLEFAWTKILYGPMEQI